MEVWSLIRSILGLQPNNLNSVVLESIGEFCLKWCFLLDNLYFSK